jgi:antitoxin HicB
VIAYPVTLTPDDNGTFLVTSPDFPEVTTFGETVEDTLERAQGALLEAIEARIHDREPIPRPSAGKRLVSLPAQAAIKILLYQALESEGIRKADLARRMSIPRQEVDRMLDLNHGTALPKMELAFAALGKRLRLSVRPRPKPLSTRRTMEAHAKTRA